MLQTKVEIDNKKELLSTNKSEMDDLIKSTPAFRREKWFRPLKKYLVNKEKSSDNNFWVVCGLRRVGKTTLLKQLLGSLIIENQINYEKILFLKIDDLMSRGLSENDIINQVNAIIEEKKIKYIFIDEINVFNKWATWLKVIHDNFCSQSALNVKLIATGSSSYELNKSDSGIGRFEILPISPWNYSEYLNFHNLNNNEENFHNYVTFGQFPEIFDKKGNEKKWEFLVQVWTNETKQLWEVKKIRESRQKINQILRHIALTTNNEIVKERMSKELQISLKILNKILNLLIECKILIEVQKSDGDLKPKRNKTRCKYYLTSSNFLLAFLKKTFNQVLEDQKLFIFVGSITETAFLQSLVSKSIATSYLQNKNKEEIDFSWQNSKGEKCFGEIKYKNNTSINEFFKKIKGERKILFTKEELKKEKKILLAKQGIKTQVLREYLQKENLYE